MTISIVGFGEVGSTLASLLNTTFKNVTFYVLDLNSNLSGRIMDFSHACASEKNEVLWNYPTALEQSDFIIYCAGYSNQKGESRDTVAASNKELVHQIFNSHNIAVHTKIIVVTNPVEKITKCLQELLPDNLVVGTGTSLDTYRLDYLVSKKLNVSLSSVKSLVLGEHGQHMVPIFSASFVDDISFEKLFTLNELEELLLQLKNAATIIRETEKASKYGVSECVCKIVKAFVGIENLEIPLSIKLNSFYKDLFQINEEAILSLPVKIYNKKLTINMNSTYSEKEFKALKTALIQLIT